MVSKNIFRISVSTPWGKDWLPIAKEIYYDLSLEKILKLIPEGSEYIGHGLSAVAFKTPSNEVVRVGYRRNSDRPSIDEMLQPISKQIIGTWQIEILPYLETKDINNAHINQMNRTLHKKGYLFVDKGINNIGFYKGKLIVIDPGAIEKM